MKNILLPVTAALTALSFCSCTTTYVHPRETKVVTVKPAPVKYTPKPKPPVVVDTPENYRAIGTPQ